MGSRGEAFWLLFPLWVLVANWWEIHDLKVPIFFIHGLEPDRGAIVSPRQNPNPNVINHSFTASLPIMIDVSPAHIPEEPGALVPRQMLAGGVGN